jgi:glycosyltransferase involved in cell wall biosynthesis
VPAELLQKSWRAGGDKFLDMHALPVSRLDPVAVEDSHVSDLVVRGGGHMPEPGRPLQPEIGTASVTSPVRLLVFTTLYPNAAQPNHGVFVENRLRHLLATGGAVARVLAPVPWFPSAVRAFGAWARYAKAPRTETRHGIDVRHPRYPVIPRVGMSVAPALLTAASLRALRDWPEPFDLIDAHYAYPDGVAAARLGAAHRVPVVITARGSDVTQLPDFPGPRRQIQRALGEAAGLIAVSAALAERLVALGAAPEKVTVLRNGVDLDLFHPSADRAAARAAWALGDRPTLVSVGALIPRKGHDRTIAALAQLPDHALLIVGEGPERGRLEALIAERGLSSRVRLLGPLPHAELPAMYGAADASVLASSREGWANVLLESMACGSPAIASNIPGNPEVVRERAGGLIVPDNTPDGIAVAVRDLFAAMPDRAATRAYAERYGWQETSEGQLAIFRRVLGRRS